MALGVNQIAALAGQFLGLVAGGLLAEHRLAGGVLGQRAVRPVRHGVVDPQPARDARTAAGPGSTGAATSPSPPARRRCSPRSPTASSPMAAHPRAGRNPLVLGGLGGGRRCCSSRSASSRPASPTRCSTWRCSGSVPSRAGNLAALLTAIARGGLQFMLIIWLQGIWLPLHGYDFESTPLWAGHLHAAADRRVPDRRARLPATSPTGSAPGCSPPAACCWSRRRSSGCSLLPVGFSYPAFALCSCSTGSAKASSPHRTPRRS